MDADMDAGSNDFEDGIEGGLGDGFASGPDDGGSGDAAREDGQPGVEEMTQAGVEEMTQLGVEEMVAAYLADLSREAERLDPNARLELLDDVRSHIEVALAEAENPDRYEVTRILTALGDPREIVDAASPEATATHAVPAMPPVFEPSPQPWDSGPPYPLGGREIVAISMLLIGAFVAGVGWLAGLWLLWASPRWSTRDKLLGTFVLPGGLAPLALVLGTASGGQACTQDGDSAPVCVQEGHGLSTWGTALAVTLLVVLPVMTSILLWRRARAVRPLVPGGGGVVTGVLVGVATVFGVMVAGCGMFMVAGTSTQPSPATPVPAVSQEAPMATSGP
jgi:hypothetical protein